MKGIICDSICKTYGGDIVLDNFSYKFKEKGLYVLYGDSGCGKTTLLNIIAGLTDMDSGTVIIDDEYFSKEVDNDKISDIVSYITQDTYFVDYLTVEENIHLCGSNTNEGESYIQKFDVSDKMHQYPKELSGGERQRLAIIQTLINKKRVLILDEPTASLDESNKQIIFGLLNELKQEVLILCSSHDDKILDYADEVIDFNVKERYTKKHYDNYRRNRICRTYKESILDKRKKVNQDKYKKASIKKLIEEVNKLYFFVRKQRKYKHREKISNIVLMFIIIFTLGVIYYVNDYDKKLEKTVEKMYNVNSIQVLLPYEDNVAKEEVLNSKGLEELAYDYRANVPTMGGEKNTDEENCTANFDFEVFVGTLPSKERSFPYIDRIIYGSYYTGDNQVIIGKNKAEEMSSNIEELIGTSYSIKMPDMSYDFEIVGIADFSDDESRGYLANSQGLQDVNSIPYVSKSFLDRYDTDDVIGDYELMYGMTMYIAYFDGYDSLKKFVDKYEDNEIIQVMELDAYSSGAKFKMHNAKTFFYPILVLSIVIVMIFYYEIKNVEVINNKHIFCVYQYYGYSLGGIKMATIRYYFSEIVRLFLYSFGIAAVGTFVINLISETYRLTSFRMFEINIEGTITVLIALVALSGILLIRLFRNIDIEGWYSVLRTRRDLL